MGLRGKRVALIGGGNMGAALAGGLLASKRVRPSQIWITDVRRDALSSLKKKLGVRVGSDNLAAARKSAVLLLCVKPQQMADVLNGLRGAVTSRHLVISIAAGIRTGFIEKRLGARVPVIRVMPNTPALLRAGALVYCLGRSAKRSHENLAKEILETAGKVWKASREDWLDAVTALSGSGPAYVFLLAECLEQAGRKLRLPPALAEALARRTIYGAGLMLDQNPEPAAVLRQRVTSPGGTTEAALKVLNRAGLTKIFENALKAATKRSRQLSAG